MAKISPDSRDFHLLRLFAVAAEERSLRRAADRLFISQPPLSRQIRKLEEILGYALFRRSRQGLELTPGGERALELVKPLLAQNEETWKKLGDISRAANSGLAMGLTTAFEQGIFARAMEAFGRRYGGNLRASRKPSPALAGDTQKGLLDMALVALPVENAGLNVAKTGYAEPLVAALPTAWPEAGRGCISLADLSSRPLFWFQREQNRAWFEHMRGIFAHLGFCPKYIEEPAEHDVLLARIAAGEGMALIAASFAAIRREDVVFAPLAEKELLRLELGIIWRDADNTGAAEFAAKLFAANFV